MFCQHDEIEVTGLVEDINQELQREAGKEVTVFGLSEEPDEFWRQLFLSHSGDHVTPDGLYDDIWQPEASIVVIGTVQDLAECRATIDKVVAETNQGYMAMKGASYFETVPIRFIHEEADTDMNEVEAIRILGEGTALNGGAVSETGYVETAFELSAVPMFGWQCLFNHHSPQLAASLEVTMEVQMAAARHVVMRLLPEDQDRAFELADYFVTAVNAVYREFLQLTHENFEDVKVVSAGEAKRLHDNASGGIYWGYELSRQPPFGWNLMYDGAGIQLHASEDVEAERGLNSHVYGKYILVADRQYDAERTEDAIKSRVRIANDRFRDNMIEEMAEELGDDDDLVRQVLAEADGESGPESP